MNRHKVISKSRWILTVVASTTLVTGCSLVNRHDNAGIGNTPTRVTVNSKDGSGSSAPIESSAVPGTPEFSVGKKLQNPIKVHLAYALWNEQQGIQIEARKSYDAVLEKQPKNIDALMGLARLDIKVNRMSDAEEKLLRAQKIAPKSAEVACALSTLYSTQKDIPRALQYMESARRLSPYDPAISHQLGVVQTKTGDLDGALASFTESVGAAEAHFNIGLILHEMGNVTAAESHLQQALSLKADLPQAQKLLGTIRQERDVAAQGVARAKPADAKAGANSSGIQPVAYSQPELQ